MIRSRLRATLPLNPASLSKITHDCLLETVAANAWIEHNLPEDRTTFGRTVIDHRYMRDILIGIFADELRVSFPGLIGSKKDQELDVS